MESLADLERLIEVQHKQLVDKGVLQPDDPAEADGHIGGGGFAQAVSGGGGAFGGGAAGVSGGGHLRSASSEDAPDLLWDLNLSTSSLDAMLGAGGKASLDAMLGAGGKASLDAMLGAGGAGGAAMRENVRPVTPRNHHDHQQQQQQQQHSAPVHYYQIEYTQQHSVPVHHQQQQQPRQLQQQPQQGSTSALGANSPPPKRRSPRVSADLGKSRGGVGAGGSGRTPGGHRRQAKMCHARPVIHDTVYLCLLV